MRPTLLLFKSPKELTPDAYNPALSYTGRSLRFLSPKGDFKKSTFSRASRFNQYAVDEKRTGYYLGPGSYNVSPKRDERCLKYRQYHANKDTTNNGYFFVGNSLEFHSRFVLPSRRKSLNDLGCNGDSTIVLQNKKSSKNKVYRKNSIKQLVHKRRHRRQSSHLQALLQKRF